MDWPFHMYMRRLDYTYSLLSHICHTCEAITIYLTLY